MAHQQCEPAQPKAVDQTIYFISIHNRKWLASIWPKSGCRMCGAFNVFRLYGCVCVCLSWAEPLLHKLNLFRMSGSSCQVEAPCATNTHSFRLKWMNVIVPVEKCFIWNINIEAASVFFGIWWPKEIVVVTTERATTIIKRQTITTQKGN